jgi:thioredoxin 1
MTIHIRSMNEYLQAISKAQSEGKLIVVYFYAVWCGPCQKLKPLLDELYDQYRNKLEIYKIDIDQNENIADFSLNLTDERIRSIPTLKFIIEGRVKKILEGYNPKIIKATFNEYSQYK